MTVEQSIEGVYLVLRPAAVVPIRSHLGRHQHFESSASKRSILYQTLSCLI